MSEETYYAGAYWGHRPESAQECAQRAETFFRLLAECDPGYTRWFEQANSLKRALQLQFDPTFDTFVRFFGKKKNQIFDDGFIFSAWTGHVNREHEGGVVMLSCGSAAEFVPNSVLLYLPRPTPGKDRVLTAPG